VLRLKEIFSNVSQDKDKLAQENKQLKSTLVQKGIPLGASGGHDDLVSNPSVGYTSSASISGHSYTQGSRNALTPPLTSQSTTTSVSPSAHTPVPMASQLGGQHGRNQAGQQVGSHHGADYEQAGIDFVLTYDNHHPSKAYLSPPPQ
jgi:hypothetical protein